MSLIILSVLILMFVIQFYKRKKKVSVYKGNKEISELYHGSTKISKLYHGSKLVYESYKEPLYISDMSGYRYGVMNKSTAIVDKGVYNNGTILSRSKQYCIIDGKVWYNYMTSNVSSLNGSNYYHQPTISALGIFFKNGGLYTYNGQYGQGPTLRLSGGWTMGFGKPESNSNSVYAIKNKEIYKIVFSTGPNPSVESTVKIMDFNSSVVVAKDYYSNYVIIDNNLYIGARSSSLTLVDSDGWTVLNGSYGIKNGCIYRINNDTTVLFNNSKTWVDISPFFGNSNVDYFISDNGSLGKRSYDNFILEPFRESHNLKGRWEKFANYGCVTSGSNPKNLIIRNGALYAFTDSDITLIDDSKYYTECSGSCGDERLGVAVSSGNRILAPTE